MKKVSEFVEEAKAAGYKVDTFDNGIHMLDYPLKYQEETRFQRVYLRDWYDEKMSRDSYFINSYIADYNRNFDLERVLREAEFGRMSMICIKQIPDGQGGTKEGLYTQTSVPVNYINGDFKEFMSLVYEVAANADYIEKIFFANDVS